MTPVQQNAVVRLVYPRRYFSAPSVAAAESDVASVLDLRGHHFKLRHHPIVLVLDHVAMEHVHAHMISELQFYL